MCRVRPIFSCKPQRDGPGHGFACRSQGWFQGLKKYFTHHSIKWDDFIEVIQELFYLTLVKLNQASIQEIQDLITISATKGGLLEFVCNRLQDKLPEIIQEFIFSKYKLSDDKFFQLKFADLCFTTLEDVLEHGQRKLQ